MDVEGVMVSYDYSGPEGEANIITVAASGIKFSDRWVLTHGSILSPLKIAKDIFRAKGKIIHNDQIYETLPEIYITCERPEVSETGHSDLDEYCDELEDASRRRGDAKNGSVTHGSYQGRVLTGRVRHMWQCPVLDRCVDDILYSWTIGHRDGDIEKQSELGKVLLSVIILVDLAPDVKESGPIRPLSALLDAVGVPPGRGAILNLHSTPFGCEVFLNSSTTGTVCGVVGRQPCLLLTDAATALGSEGGPAFITVDGKRTLVGMVVCSVSWWRGEWVGLTLIAPLATVLSTKLRISDKFAPTTGPAIDTSLTDNILRTIDASVVLVRCGSMWGSGIYLGDGYFVTCSHVVSRYEPTKVSIFCGGEQQVAIVKYRTPNHKAYDLALIYSNPEYWTKLVKCAFATTPAVKGETVIAIGYPYFNERNFKSLKPTITRGQVNNTSPSMLQTSCCVQSGFSGGPICRLTRDSRHSMVTCEVLGMIVCNAKTQKSACYPYINMAVPVYAFRNVLLQYMKTKDKETLKMVENKQDHVQSQWRLQPYRSKI